MASMTNGSFLHVVSVDAGCSNVSNVCTCSSSASRSGASWEGVRDHLVPATQLELDPYYHEYELPD